MTNQLEPKLKKQATNILEKARRIMGITRDQYAFCQYIHYRCADPRQKVSGWCCDLKEEIGQFVGISRVAVHKMAKAMEESGLISVSVGGYYKVTETWIDIESDCKQSLQKNGKQDVNFVYMGRKQSLQINREKRKQSLHTPYSIDNKEFEECENTPPPAENFNNLEEEKSPLPPKVAPKGSAPARPIPDASSDLLVKIYRPETPGIVEAECISVTPLGTYPNASNPKDLKAALLRYASEYPDNWRDNVLEVGRATSWTEERVEECLTDFCAYQFKLDNTKAKFSQYTASFSLWLKGQLRFDKPGASQPGPTSNKANLNRLGSDPSKYEEAPLF